MKKLFSSTTMLVCLILIIKIGYGQEKMSNTNAKISASAKPTLATAAQDGTVADIVAASNMHSTLLVALKSAGLVEALSGAGPFTVFAPTNDAFSKIPTASLDNLLKPENKATLTKLLQDHVISGVVKAEDIIAAIKAGNGKASFTTLAGDKLTATLEAEKVKLTDGAGNTSIVTATNMNATNGVLHVIDTVLASK